MRAAELTDEATLDEYLKHEDALFREVEERIEALRGAASPIANEWGR